MIAIRIDFETRSHCDLKAVGAWHYSLHSTTEVLCYSTKINDGPVWGTFVTESLADFDLEVIQDYQLSHLHDDATFEAHNAGFELAIWENIMHRRHGWPKPDPKRFFCSAAKAAAHGLPRDLENAAQAMHLDVQKDKKGHALMLKLSKPRPHWKKTSKGDVYFGSREEFERLLDYCKQDVETEYALSNQLRPLNPQERKLFLLDLKVNRRGFHCDRKLISKAIEINKIEASRGHRLIADLTNGVIQTNGQTEKIRKYLYTQFGYALPNMQAETLEAALKTDIPEGVEKILLCRQKHSKASVKKYEAMLNRAGDDDRIREILLYHGAHTGRWAGIKIQPQNYPRPKLPCWEIENLLIPAILDKRLDLLELYRGSVSAALSDTLRSSLTAAPGHDLLGADYSSIEFRVLCWLAGENRALRLFRENKDVYIDMASTIYGIPSEKILEGYKKGEHSATRQRKVGKETVLGCGYQMGAPRFESECEEKGIDLPEGMASFIIETFRNKYGRIKALWYDVAKTALRALSSLITTTVGRPIKMGRQGQFFCIQLPSKRLLTYADPEIRINQFGKRALSHMHVHPKTKKWVRNITYGGALVENIVQGIARDIMAHAMLQAEAQGYRIVATVHDEIVAEVPKSFGSIEEFERILCDIPPWAQGCPITAEGWRGKRYRK